MELFYSSLGLFVPLSKITGVMFVDRRINSSIWTPLFVNICAWFWIIFGILNNFYLIVHRGAFETIMNLLVANQSGSLMTKDFIYIYRQLGIPFFSFVTHIMIYTSVGSTMKSFWKALKPIDHLLNSYENFNSLQKCSKIGLMWITAAVSARFQDIFL